MARVTYVKSARPSKKGTRRCSGCGKEIKVGESYKWFANRIGRMSMRKNFCSTCVIRPSMMTTSPHLQTIYAAQEAADDALDALGETGDLGDIAQVLRDCAEGYRDAQQSYEESADNMENGFGHETQMSQEIREKASACEQAADELYSAADEIEWLDGPGDDNDSFVDDFDASGEFDGELDDDGKPVDQDEYDRALEEFAQSRRDERREAAMEQARDAIGQGVQI